MIEAADKNREGQGVGRGSSYMRRLAPAASGPAALVELVVANALMLALGYAVLPDNPLLLNLGFPWIWILPAVLALRYGTLAGVGSVLMILAGWFVFDALGVPLGAFPRLFFLGGLLLVLIAGQFGDVWATRLSRARALNRYLDERLAALTKNHYLLRISHSRLESDLLARPTTLRDTLAQVRNVAIDDASAAAGAVTTGKPSDKAAIALSGAQAMLQVAAQACQIDSAALYALNADGVIEEPVAAIGAGFGFDPHDPLVEHCLNTRELAHVQTVGLPGGAPGEPQARPTRYVAVAPVMSGADKLVGLLVVESMPFLSLSYENLQLLMVLMGYYADGVEHADATRSVLAVLPDCPTDFALDYARLARMRRESGIESTIVALVFGFDDALDAPFDQIVRSRRALDVAWQVSGTQQRALLTLMPLSDGDAATAYLVRIGDMLRAQFGIDFEAGHIGIHTLRVPGNASAEPLQRMLRHCRLDAAPATAPDSDTVTAVPASAGAAHG